ncbi:TaqI-like C-terminal specificity domain-containing protein [Treponema phagedenis]|uniref:site-specific DNA-methyltransferase (adenine-specific) n=1 Tax=Treponema phagedenis TaxID=162 RepID=A0A0B7H0M0_TREPH|nr:TaqI-like C-terminal specificity domain-containing protein [Treponema phagedenis]CEM63427.1 conserved hypothetical protein [Treponema phagedenis]
MFQYWGNSENKLFVIYTDSKFKEKKEMKPYPNLKKHLDVFEKIITSYNKPYGLHRARDEKFFTSETILSLRKTERPKFTYTDFPCYVSQSYMLIKTDRWDLKFLTAVLNSKLIAFWLRHKGKMQGDNFQIDKAPLLAIPLPALSPDRSSLISKLISLAEHMIVSQEELFKARFESDKKFLQQRVDILDEQINRAVYELYGLSDEEIEIVEGEGVALM